VVSVSKEIDPSELLNALSEASVEKVGAAVGEPVGKLVGSLVGMCVGVPVGELVGAPEG